MNSKQRVLNNINHEPADRVPVNLSANRFVREILMHRFNLNSHIDLLNHFNSDIVDLRDCVHPNYIGPGKRTFQIGDGIIDQNPNPLATYIFSRDKTLIGEFLRKTQAGTASVNDTVMQILPPYLP